MLQPRSSKLSSFITNLPVRQSLPTGKGFGGSNLDRDRGVELSLPIASKAISIETSPQPVVTGSKSLLIVEFGKIVCVGLWFWCLLGANFCVNRVGAIANFYTPVAGADRC